MIREYVVKVTDTFLPGAFQRFESDWSPEQELVRCKDCKHFNDMKCSYPERGTCDLWNMLHWGDWYCADGERRDDDA